MELEKEKFDEAMNHLRRALTAFEELTENKEGDKNRNYWAKRMGILAEVMLEGGIVTSQKWRELGEQYGYDIRGLSGFFTGKNASMTKLGRDKRAITESGEKDVLEWLECKWEGKPQRDQLEKFKSLLEE